MITRSDCDKGYEGSEREKREIRSVKKVANDAEADASGRLKYTGDDGVGLTLSKQNATSNTSFLFDLS